MSAKYSAAAFTERFGPWAVIAGGSDGIGAAFAAELAQRGLNLVVIARDEDKLARKASEIEANSNARVRSLCLDLTRPDLAEQVAAATDDLDVGLLIYNAGSGRQMGSFLDRPVENWMRQVHLACQGPLALAHHFGGRMRSRGRGGIVLMSSLSSLVGSAYIATYSAAKAFDTTLGEGLWQELGPAGVDVVSCLAGATDTETFRDDTGGSPDAMAPADVATGTLDFLGCGPVYVPGAGNQAAATALTSTPRIPLINGMSEINARNFELPYEAGSGLEFTEEPE